MRPTGWTIYIERTLSVQHLVPTGVSSENRARADILCSKTKAFLLITVSEPSDVGLRHAQTAGQGVYGGRISCFSQPCTVPPPGMRLFLIWYCRPYPPTSYGTSYRRVRGPKHSIISRLLIQPRNRKSVPYPSPQSYSYDERQHPGLPLPTPHR